MHLYIATRGQKHLVETLMNNLQGIMLPYKATPHADKNNPSFLQMGIRPLQLWEIAFPEEHLNVVLASLEGSEFRTDDNRWIPSFIGWCMKLKGILGLKDIPKDYDKTKKFLIPNRDPAIDIKYIGIKKDEYGKVELV